MAAPASPASAATPTSVGGGAQPPAAAPAAELALRALRAMDFDWVARRDDVWVDGPYDVPDLHEELRAEFDEALEELVQSPGKRSPLGWFVVGSGGRGKTHLLGVFRRRAIAKKAAFVQVDLTDVRSFWDTVLQGMVNSLQQPYEEGRRQFQTLLQNAVSKFKTSMTPQRFVAILHGRKSVDLAGDVKKILAAFAKHPRARTPPRRHQDVIRALVCLNSSDRETAALGLSWLQGVELDEEERRRLEFQSAVAPPREIAEGLSWLMGFSGPTVLAFDQLDPIVTQAERAAGGAGDASGAAAGIVRDVGDGLGALCQIFDRTLPVVVCLEQTFESLRKHALQTALDRFGPPQALPAIADGRIVEAVVRRRLAPAFQKSGFTPPYDTWPFAPALFEQMANLSPREVLQRCDAHRRKCLQAKAAEELTSLLPVKSPPGPRAKPGSAEEAGSASPLDAKFLAYQQDADPKSLLEEKEEDLRLAPLLQSALLCLAQEADLPPQVTAAVDAEFAGGAKTKPLHARLRLIFHAEDDREEHFSTRALQLTNAVAYISRLKAAVTGAGIDRRLPFRRLVVVRTTPRPTGEKSVALAQEFEKNGGVFYAAGDQELRALHALHRLREENEAGFLDWLRARRPAGALPLLRALAPHPLLGTAPGPKPQPPAGPTIAQFAEKAVQKLEEASREAKPSPTPSEQLAPLAPAAPPPASVSGRTGCASFGRRASGTLAQEEWKLPTAELARHVVVMAGAGSGKAALLRRIVEEAAIEGVPSIVVDCGSDLTTLGEAQPSPPSSWNAQDADKARRFARESDVVVWTPGNDSGNPASFDFFPDFASMLDAPEELHEAVDLVAEALLPIVAARASARSADPKRTLLRSTLHHFARCGGGGLDAYLKILRALPKQAGGAAEKVEKLARETADALAAAQDSHLLLRKEGTPLDPAVLFGDAASARAGKTRISVASLVGLPTSAQQQAFVCRLATTLFGWIRRSPPPGRSLRGLLVFEEAKDFASGQKASASRESLVRLTAQGRKHGLGLVFATQNPKDLDHRIVAACSTSLFGKVNSPAGIDVVREQMRLKGSKSGDDAAQLPKGVFYAHNAGSGQGPPTKIQPPPCLSHLRPSPPTVEEVVATAAICRIRLQGG